MKSEKPQKKQNPQTDPLAGGAGPIELWRKHGNKVLIVLAVALLVMAAVRYRRAQAAQKSADAVSALALAWNRVDQLPQLQQTALASNINVARERDQIETDVNQSVQLVIDSSDPSADAARLASAWWARGELFWNLAHFPNAVPTTQTSSATQPAAKSSAQYLDLAANAYGTIVKNFSNQVLPVSVAHFGLAAIAEDKHDFSAAREHYKALIEMSALPDSTKKIAETKLAKLNELEKPMLLLPATQPVPTTVPSLESLMPSLNIPKFAAPATGPSTKPDPTPSTAPATTQP